MGKILRFENFDGGTLTAILPEDCSQVAEMHILSGLVTEQDCAFIQHHLTNLKVLDVTGSARFANDAVPKNSFAGNPVLEELHLETVETIQTSAFDSCPGLRRVYLPKVRTVQYLAFHMCTKLQRVFAPSLESIERRGFYGCINLATILLGKKPPILPPKGNCFRNVTMLTAYVHREVLDLYRLTDFWNALEIKEDRDLPKDDPPLLAPDSRPLPESGPFPTKAGCYREGSYYTGDYGIALNMFSFNQNLNAFIKKSSNGTCPATLEKALEFAAKTGFDAVDITAYYLAGYSGTSCPDPQEGESTLQYVRGIWQLCESLGLKISGTGIGNDFAYPEEKSIATDVARLKFWIDIAHEMGAEFIRVFAGSIPLDIDRRGGWERISQERIVPAFQECADYSKAKYGSSLILGMQNHGDMVSSADQALDLLNRIDRANVKLVNDTGWWREYKSNTGIGYDWYSDIEKMLPHSCNIQLKKKPGGVETQTPIDLETFFTELRYSEYHRYVSLELLWDKADADHPKNSPDQPPFDQVESFYQRVCAAMANTKIQKGKEGKS